MTLFNRSIRLACLVAGALLVPAVWADGIEAAISGLDDKRFGVREKASADLLEAGSVAIDDLERVARTGSPEASTRAILILRSHLNSSDASLRPLARKALERVSKEAAPVVRRNADKAIVFSQKPPKVDIAKGRRDADEIRQALFQHIRDAQAQGQAPDQELIREMLDQMRKARAGHVKPPGVGGIALGGVVAGRGAFKSRTTVRENNRSITIEESSNEGIKIWIEKTMPNGAKVKTEYRAKTAEQLRKQHPEAFKLYSKYGRHKGRLGGQQHVAPQRRFPQDIED